MISSEILEKIHKSGDIASQIDQLYSRKNNGTKYERIIGIDGQVPIETVIEFQEERLEQLLTEIQKGFKRQISIV